MKKSLTALRESTKKKDAAITELYQAVFKLQMAVDLDCKPSDIEEKFVDVPQSHLARVIGKGGSNIKEIESSCKVKCDVLKNELKIRVTGSDKATDAAIVSIENITLAVDVTVELKKEVRSDEERSDELIMLPLRSCVARATLAHPNPFRDSLRSSQIVNSLLSNKAALLNEIQTSLKNVRLSIPRKSTTLTIHGKQSVIDKAIEKINGLDIAAAYLTLSTRELGIVIGKGGATIKEVRTDEASYRTLYMVSLPPSRRFAPLPPLPHCPQLEADHSVTLEILSRSDDAADNLEIVGTAHNVEKATNAIELLVSENEVLEEAMEVIQAHRNLFLSDTAAVIKVVQKESGAYLRMSANTIPQNSKGGMPASPSSMTIKGTRAQISSARKLVEEQIEAYEATVTTITVDSSALPAIIGKRGENIKVIRKATKVRLTLLGARRIQSIYIYIYIFIFIYIYIFIFIYILRAKPHLRSSPQSFHCRQPLRLTGRNRKLESSPRTMLRSRRRRTKSWRSSGITRLRLLPLGRHLSPSSLASWESQ